jgi:hypothetical protein
MVKKNRRANEPSILRVDWRYRLSRPIAFVPRMANTHNEAALRKIRKTNRVIWNEFDAEFGVSGAKLRGQ